jgi:hypothetical protein
VRSLSLALLSWLGALLPSAALLCDAAAAAGGGTGMCAVICVASCNVHKHCKICISVCEKYST